MADELRTCARTGCRWPAAASLSYRYATRQVWLLDLSAQPDPALYDLCPHHADALVVPRGWERVEQRTEREAVREPSGADLVERAAALGARLGAEQSVHAGIGGSSHPPGRARSIGSHTNRYASLNADLPRLAAAVNAAMAGEADDEPDAEPPAASGAPRPPVRRPLPSRDLAPVPTEDRPPPRAATADPAELADDARENGGSGEPQAEGQLAIPVDDLTEDTGAIVVSIDRGRRS